MGTTLSASSCSTTLQSVSTSNNRVSQSSLAWGVPAGTKCTGYEVATVTQAMHPYSKLFESVRHKAGKVRPFEIDDTHNMRNGIKLPSQGYSVLRLCIYTMQTCHLLYFHPWPLHLENGGTSHFR